ncbi:hypothetical protein PAXRUDRAFT_34675 [Paxillus rubicundulus Ve08.2h10]|uniref:Heterokaryon incompatibility domain-containing protein n=1 Tax=Paxillus rubicundulus Ve08.2h10 TaxID=930991 RepID=A0A0D0D5V1_9AGAM|nr:hypothetical protein PAXRUDRAFT_34675 [Paxillus rubicundulus Ve08.2h10]
MITAQSSSWQERRQGRAALASIRQRLLDHFDHLVSNDIPTRLLEVGHSGTIMELKFVMRDEIRKTLWPQIEAITDADLERGWPLASWGEGRWKYWCEDLIQVHLKYAIFSHHWGVDEPQFQEVSNLFHNKKPLPDGLGYNKLRNFCEKAMSDYGCKYVWSDTCCINKESSAELEEAIRSMFRWYRGSSVCIAHLAKSSSTIEFSVEPWFMRGWTLQELLAPGRMRFYGKDWMPIGSYPQDSEFYSASLVRVDGQINDKNDQIILNAISECTDIPKSVLQHFNPSCCGVLEKMRWAAKRKTTRVEDIAYSLLGIFDVSMPIAYGEGNRAFHRLMEAISHQCMEPWFFAWAGKASQYSCALPSSPACYGGLDPKMASTLASTLPSSVSYEITKQGLQVKLLLVPTELHHTHCSSSHHHILNPPQYAIKPFKSIVQSVTIIDSTGFSSTLLSSWDYTLGVVSYGRVDTDPSYGQLHHGDHYLCLLLKRPKNMKWQHWRRIPTDNVLVLDCGTDWKGKLELVCLLHSYQEI